MATLTCNDCGTCVDVAAPKRLRAWDSEAYKGEQVEILFTANQVIKAGTLMGEIRGDSSGVGAQPQVYKAFDPLATDGSQFAVGFLMWDTITDANGRISNWSGKWGKGRDMGQLYITGKFDVKDLTGDLPAAKNSGLPIRIINGMAYLG